MSREVDRVDVIIAGNGQVGSALAAVVASSRYRYRVVDPLQDLDYEGQAVYLNICFPYFDNFDGWVASYKILHRPLLTIVHSTVPIGTCRRIGAVHSPVIGRHPDLRKSLVTFGKPIGAVEEGQAWAASRFLRAIGISPVVFSSPEETEAAKLLSTLRLGLDVKFEKEVFAFCEKKRLSFDEVYTRWTRIYNEGYRDQGLERFVRPIIEHVPGRISGHCVEENAEMLYEFPPAVSFRKFNKTAEGK